MGYCYKKTCSVFFIVLSTIDVHTVRLHLAHMHNIEYAIVNIFMHTLRVDSYSCTGMCAETVTEQ
jgi:hypothetical protein